MKLVKVLRGQNEEILMYFNALLCEWYNTYCYGSASNISLRHTTLTPLGKKLLLAEI